MITKTTYTKACITLELAQDLMTAATTKALELNKSMVIAIVDESGHLKAFHRMDSAPLVSIEVAQNKAYTAVANAWGHATHEIYDYISKNPATLIGIPHIPRYTILGGGFPIRIDKHIIGGIGISGGSAEQDMIVARAALAILK